MSKHTPGPWCVVGADDGEGNWSHLEVVQSNQRHMAVCFLTSDGPKLENAHLISKAPAMLSLLERIYTECDERDGGGDASFSGELLEELRRFVKEMQK